ncbi:MAG: amidohydrolase, partial [Chitinophagaceae bacterium]
MNKIVIYTTLFFSLSARSQETVYPTPPQAGSTIITNATVHVGNGQVLEGASILITGGKIVSVGTSVTAPAGATRVDASGKHVYPGLILPVSTLGLVEINSVRATVDAVEIGELNPNIRSIVAYNTDSKIINTLRSSGILLANVVPQGGLLSGASSIVQLDAWNWEDAAYKTDAGIHLNMPLMLPRPAGARGGVAQQGPVVDPVKQGLEQVDKLKSFLKEAQAYNSVTDHEETNLKFAAVKGLFNKS